MFHYFISIKNSYPSKAGVACSGDAQALAGVLCPVLRALASCAAKKLLVPESIDAATAHTFLWVDGWTGSLLSPLPTGCGRCSGAQLLLSGVPRAFKSLQKHLCSPSSKFSELSQCLHSILV